MICNTYGVIKSLLIVALLSYLSGCDKFEGDNKSLILSEVDRKTLEGKVYIPLPEDTIVLRSYDGGRRDASYGYYHWLIFSQDNNIELHPDVVKSPNSYLPNRNVSDIAEYIQSIIPKRELSPCISAASLSWEDGGYEFNGSYLKTSGGDYLSIRRFKK